MKRSEILSQDTAEQRFAARGYGMLGRYSGRHHPVLLRCDRHAFEAHVLAGNIFSGGSLRCCAKESMRGKLSVSMRGNGNHFYGRSHSDATKSVISEKNSGKNNPRYGVPRPQAEIDLSRAALVGRPRDSATKRKLSEHWTAAAKHLDYYISKAAAGKTAGRPGFFYIARVGELLKFGSTTQPHRRLRHFKVAGEAEYVLLAAVPDAGAYEALMMDRCRDHWIRGEQFRDFLGRESSLAA